MDEHCSYHDIVKDHITEAQDFRDRVIKNEVKIEIYQEALDDMKKKIDWLLLKIVLVVGIVNIATMLGLKITN